MFLKDRNEQFKFEWKPFDDFKKQEEQEVCKKIEKR